MASTAQARAAAPARSGWQTAVHAVLGFVGRWYSVAVVLLLWELIVRSGWVNPRLFPSLGVIWDQLVLMFSRGTIWDHLLATLIRVAAGFGLACAGGVLLGFAMARFRWVDRLFEPLFSFGYPIPRVALYPVFVFVFGLGHLSKIAMIFLECLYPIAVNTYYGTRAVNERYVWAARNMGANEVQVFWKVIVPSALPQIFAGLRIALPVALVIAILTEMIGATEGMGYLIAYASASLSRSQVFAGVVVIAVVGFVLDRVLAIVRRRLVFWERESVQLL
ncbi:MAG: ABC transporter permease [Chloroflexi bacterium]|nr:ABC transporter permease [Chloroflexota bacterium]